VSNVYGGLPDYWTESGEQYHYVEDELGVVVRPQGNIVEVQVTSMVNRVVFTLSVDDAEDLVDGITEWFRERGVQRH
jgi:hypothetical protein